MIALIDVNNFYASCEQVFNPSLTNQPVVVLSNNDSCIIARNALARALGFKMGQPVFQVRAELKQHNVVVLSSNYPLYGDLSSRFANVLRTFSAEVEVYSIDEAFVSLSAQQACPAYVGKVRQTIRQQLGLPTGIGVSLTKTLAKVANYLAKKDPSLAASGVCILPGEAITEVLACFPVEEVWGIGPRYTQWLHQRGVRTAGEFRALPERYIKSHFSVVGQRLWRELHGEPCLDLELVSSRRKNICTSRTFSSPLFTADQLQEPVATFASRCAQKLRNERSVANLVSVFVHTDRHQTNQPQYSNSINVPLGYSSANTFEIVQAALRGLRYLYRPGFAYRKAGVIVGGIVPDSSAQISLFAYEDPRHRQLTKVMDQLNARYGTDTVRLGASGTHRKWRIKADRKSPLYTTKYAEIPLFNAD